MTVEEFQQPLRATAASNFKLAEDMRRNASQFEQGLFSAEEVVALARQDGEEPTAALLLRFARSMELAAQASRAFRGALITATVKALHELAVRDSAQEY